MTAEPIRAAILGTGHGHDVGKLRVLQQSPEWEVAGVCEPDPARRDALQGQPAWEGVRRLELDELLEDPTIRVAVVESDVPRLVPLGSRAVAAGKHLHLDKPAGTDLEAFQNLLDEAGRQGLVVQMGYMFRYNAGFDLVRQAVREGWLGRVHFIHGCINTEHRPETRRQLAFHPGGMMLELACHLIDMLVLLMGRPGKVHSFLRHDGALDDRLADNTLAVFEFGSAMASIECSALEYQAFPRRQFEVIGDRGSVVLEPLEPPSARLSLREARDGYSAGWQNVPVPDIPRYVRDLEELARCVRTGAPLPYSREHDFTVQETVLRACAGIRG